MVPKPFEITCGFCFGENSGSKVFPYTQRVNLLLMKSSALRINNLATLEALLPFHSQGCYCNKTKSSALSAGTGERFNLILPAEGMNTHSKRSLLYVLF